MNPAVRETIGADLAGKTALITGGATGIGLAIATALHAHGMRVAIADINPAAAAAAAAGISTDAIAIAMDVSKRAWAAEATVSRYSKPGSPRRSRPSARSTASSRTQASPT